jgi:hypothetical protein
MGGVDTFIVCQGSRTPEVLRSVWLRQVRMVTMGCGSCRSWLVTGGEGFYNPSNTALEAVVSFIRTLGTQTLCRMAAASAGECTYSHSTLRNSQEH